MKPLLFPFALFALSFLLGGLAQAEARQLAFPGAEGAGKYALGGRGGDVYKVTSLADDGPGSLRYGIESATGPRTIVFEVDGTIALERTLVIDKPYLTIAGQTAPGDGIAISNYTVEVRDTHDLVMRHLRIRLGDLGGVQPGGQNALKTDDIEDVIFDHLSISWGVDANHDLRHGARVTVQWCIMSEALHDSVHPKGPHAKGASYRDPTGPISLHHNLYSTSVARHPTLGTAGHHLQRNRPLDDLQVIDFRNNVIYNWTQTVRFGDHFINAINNYWKPGPESRPERLPIAVRSELPVTAGGFMSGNVFEGNEAWSRDNFTVLDFEREDRYLFDGSLRDWMQPEPDLGDFLPSTDEAGVAFVRVLRRAGASLRRDAVDERVIADVLNGTGRVIDSQDDVGGWPQLRQGRSFPDADGDGMPDWWEVAHGLNPQDPADGNLDRNGDGYTNLEEYLNWLAGP